jgi:large subunit ribosomal protein LP0
MPLTREKKDAYFVKIAEYLNNYSRLFLVTADNVGSRQMANIRISLRGKAEVLFGKNTMMRRALRLFLAENKGHPFEKLMPKIQGNIGFVFCDGEMTEIRDLLTANVVPAPARSGAIAPCNVYVPPGPTGCDPGQTGYFQAMNIGTKIVKGQIEIVSEVFLFAKGDIVNPGQAALLQKLDIQPFSYGLKIDSVYDNGSLFAPEVLDLGEDDLAAKFIQAVRKVAAVSLALEFPTMASLRFSIANAFVKVLALSLESGVAQESTQIYHDYLADPTKFAGMAAAATAGDAAEAAPEVEEEPEEEVSMGSGNLFGDDEDGGDY